MAEEWKLLLKKILKTAWWMLRLMIPISFIVSMLNYLGWLYSIAQIFSPIFKWISLPGEAALVYITSIFLNIYSAIAIIGSLSLNHREITIIAIMCLIAHNLPIEVTIQKQTGSSAINIILLRLIASFIAAMLLNLVLPQYLTKTYYTNFHPVDTNFIQFLQNWFFNIFPLSIKLLLIISGLLTFQKLLNDYGILNELAKFFMPLMKPMGLSEKVAFHWLIGNIVGLTYGAAIMFDEVKKRKISVYNAKLLNYHIAISHSLLEDTLLFVAIGVSAFWITFPRILIAIGAVWLIIIFRKCLKKQRINLF